MQLRICFKQVLNLEITLITLHQMILKKSTGHLTKLNCKSFTFLILYLLKKIFYHNIF